MHDRSQAYYSLYRKILEKAIHVRELIDEGKSELPPNVQSLKDRLTEFYTDEAEDYLKEIVETHPHWSKTIDVLYELRSSLLQDLSHISKNLQRDILDKDLLIDWLNRFERFLRKEGILIIDAYNLVYGGDDG